MSPVPEPGKGRGDIGGGEHFWAPAHPVTCKRAVLVWVLAQGSLLTPSKSEGVSKTTGILGKLSQSFPLAAPRYF